MAKKSQEFPKLLPGDIKDLCHKIANLPKSEWIPALGLLFQPHPAERTCLRVCIPGAEYSSYFWWERGDRYTISYPSLEEVQNYWENIITMLNEAPHVLFDAHQKKQAFCLYYYRQTEK